MGEQIGWRFPAFLKRSSFYLGAIGALSLVGCISGESGLSVRQAQQLVARGGQHRFAGAESIAATVTVENTTEMHATVSGTLLVRFVDGTYEATNSISLGDGFTVTIVRPIHRAGEEAQLPIRAEFDLGNQGWTLARFENTDPKAVGSPLSSFRNPHDETTPEGKRVADLAAAALQLSGEIKAAQARLNQLAPEYDSVITHGWISPATDYAIVARLFPGEDGLSDKLAVHGFETDYAGRFKSIAKPLFDRDMSAAQSTINTDAAKLADIAAQLRNS